MISNVAAVAGGKVANLVVSDTTLLKPSDLFLHSPEGYHFISVDAGHDPDPVYHDMQLAAAVLKPGGVIMLDDGFNSACPGVGEGMFRFLSRDQRLKAFATGHNKTMFTFASNHAVWLSLMRNEVARGDGTLFDRTRAQNEANMAARWTPTLCGSEVVTFV